MKTDSEIMSACEKFSKQVNTIGDWLEVTKRLFENDDLCEQWLLDLTDGERDAVVDELNTMSRSLAVIMAVQEYSQTSSMSGLPDVHFVRK